MLTLLKELYRRSEEIRGKKLLYVLLISFVSFVFLGLFVGYLTDKVLNRNESTNVNNNIDGNADLEEKVFEGRIQYIDPGLYPTDDISYVLIDGDGKDIILLRSVDEKLVVAEGHAAKVYGKVVKTTDGLEDILLVDRIGIQNVSN